MIRGPHVAAHEVLGVMLPVDGRLHVDGGNAQRRVHAGYAAGDAASGDRGGHLGAQRRARLAPHLGCAQRNAVDVAGHGLGEVDAIVHVHNRVL